MSKYNKIGLIIIMALCCALGSCGCEKAEKKPTVITVVHAWGNTEPDHVAMRSIFEGFQDENPDVRIQLISMVDSNRMLEKMRDMLMVGNTPDVTVFSGIGRNSIYDFMLENGLALDLMPYLKEDSDFADSVSKVNLEKWVTDENQLFTVADVLTLCGGYWYNANIFEQAGIVEVPKTWVEFWPMCESLIEWSEEQNKKIELFRLPMTSYLWILDHILADNEETIPGVMNNYNMSIKEGEIEKAVAQLKKFYEFSGSPNNAYRYRDEVSLFNEGKLAVYVSGAWAGELLAENIDAKYALLPTESGASMSCMSVGVGYVVGKSENKEKEEAALRFLKYMLGEEAQTRILMETGQIPENPNIILSEVEEEKPRLYKAASLVYNADKKIDIPINIWTRTQRNIFAENLSRVLAGDISATDFEKLLGIKQEYIAGK